MVEVVERLAGTGSDQEAKVTVVHIAKVWGTSLGIQHPALKPSSTERSAAQQVAAQAALDLRHRGVEAEALVVTGRDVGQALAGTAERAGAGALVVGRSNAGPLSRLLRGQDPARVLLGRSSCTLVVVE
jgi:nucleotide-binding universal stress UspA family protein